MRHLGTDISLLWDEKPNTRAQSWDAPKRFGWTYLVMYLPASKCSKKNSLSKLNEGMGQGHIQQLL